MSLKRISFLASIVPALSLLSSGREAQAADGTWYPITGDGPSARHSPAGCYDSQGKRMIIFGGEDATGLKNDVWALSLGTSCPQWTQITPTGTQPPPRDEHRMIYDPIGNRVILFGGETEGSDPSCLSNPLLGDVWQLSLGASPAWSQVTTTGRAACARGGHTAVYLPGTGQMVVHGGEIRCGTFYTNGTFFLGLSDMHWDPFTCAEDPSTCVDGCVPNPYGLHCGETCPGWIGARWYHAAIYDPVGGRMVVHGGTYENAGAETWVLPFSGSWSQLFPTGSPIRENHRGVYDSIRRRMLIFGGDDDVVHYSSVYALSMVSPTAWSQLTTSGGPPSGRSFSAAVYDPDNDRLVVFGGDDVTTTFGDTWQLRFSDSAPATTGDLGIVGVTTGPNTVKIRWTAPTDDAAGACQAAGYTVRKRLGSEITEANWATSIVVTGASGPSAPGVQDSITLGSLASGVWWYFALKTTDSGGNSSAISNNDCIRFGIPIQWCGGADGSAAREGPSAAELAITSVRPNPTSAGGADVSFSLADGSPATLKVFDVAGRLVEAHDLASLGPGFHELSIGGRSKLPPGHYRVRISQGGRSASRSVIVVP